MTVSPILFERCPHCVLCVVLLNLPLELPKISSRFQASFTIEQLLLLDQNIPSSTYIAASSPLNQPEWSQHHGHMNPWHLWELVKILLD